MKQTEQESLNFLHIKKPVFDYEIDPSPTKFSEMYNNIMIRMAEGGKAPMPLIKATVVTLDPSGMSGNNDIPDLLASDLYARIEDENGKIWIPLYTDRKAISEQFKTNDIQEVPIRDVIKAACVNKSVSGVLINPNGLNFPLTKQYLKLMVKEEPTYADLWKVNLDAVTGEDLT